MNFKSKELEFETIPTLSYHLESIDIFTEKELDHGFN